MKRKTILISLTLIVIVAIAGSSMAWQMHKSEGTINKIKMSTVKVEVVGGSFRDINEVVERTYNKNIQVESLGTGNTYVRVRIVPEWSEPSLPVSNVGLDLATNTDWTEKQPDGYYYFKYYLTKNQLTSPLLQSITFTELGPEYEDADFTLKIVTEGVQTTHEAWKDIWGITNLPFTPDYPWTP